MVVMGSGRLWRFLLEFNQPTFSVGVRVGLLNSQKRCNDFCSSGIGYLGNVVDK